MDGFEAVQEIAKACNGTITSAGACPDGSGFATVSFPLPKTHWIYQGDQKHDWGWSNVPPMPFRMGSGEHAVFAVQRHGAIMPDVMTRDEISEKVRKAARYAVRAATMNGSEMDFDPDALVRNLIVGLFGYHTEDGLSSDEWANPPKEV